MQLPPHPYRARKTCLICSEPWGARGTPTEPTWEHSVPDALGGKLQAQILCRRCNSTFGSRVDSLLFSSPLVQYAILLLRETSSSADTLSQNHEFVGLAESVAGSRPLSLFEDAIEVLQPDGGVTQHGTVMPLREFPRWWRSNGRAEATGRLGGVQADLLQQILTMARNRSRILIALPGGGSVRHVRQEFQHHFVPSVQWAPIVKMAYMTVMILRPDLDLRLLTDGGPMDVGDALGRPTANDLNPLTEPEWPESRSTPQVDIRWILRGEDLLQVDTRIFGAYCGSCYFEVGHAAEGIEPYVMYSVMCDTHEEWLFLSREDGENRRGVPLHAAETTQRLREQLAGEEVTLWSPPELEG